MAALAADRMLRKKAQITLQRYPVKGGTVGFYGAQVCVDATGYLVPASDTAGLKHLGLLEEAYDATGLADGAIEALVYRGAAFVPYAAGSPLTQASVGADCFVADDNEVAATTTNSVIAGEVLEFSSSGAWVNFAGKR